MRKLRFRHLYMGVGSLLVLLALFFSDPDVGFIQNLSFGAGFFATMVVLTKIVIYVALVHVSRRALIDYIDLERYFKEAVKTPEGSGQAVVGVSLIMVALAILVAVAVFS